MDRFVHDRFDYQREAQIHSFLSDPLSNIERLSTQGVKNKSCYLNCTSAENQANFPFAYETSVDNGKICQPRQRTALKPVKFRTTEQRRVIYLCP